MAETPHDHILDPLIAPYVEALQAAGIETFESCQGGEGHAFTGPVIRFHGGAGEGFKATAHAIEHHWPVIQVGRYWDVRDGAMHGPYWEMVFHDAALRQEPPHA